MLVTFPDGKSVKAADAEGVLAAWREKQWSKVTPEEWRLEVTKRALAWSGEEIDSELPADELLAALAKCGLLKIT